MGLRSHSIEHNSCHLTYDVRGNGAPVLFIQGVGVHGDGWLPQVNSLADTYTCVSFDNRGMARSQPVSQDLTVAQMADDVRAILDAEGWSTAHIVGHSLGGLIALEFAISHPKRVCSLSLMCTFANGRDAAPLTLRMAWAGLRSRVGTRRMRREGFLKLLMPPPSPTGREAEALAERLAPLFGHDIADQPPIVNAQLRAMRATDTTLRLGELAGIPTLVVVGAHDPISPPKLGKVLATGIPGAKYVEYADASHGLPIQWADRVNVLLREHIGTKATG